MTPEERAVAICERLNGGSNDAASMVELPVDVLVEVISDSIKEAENMLLERAALALEAKMTPETEDEELSYHGAFAEAADVVRKLKAGIGA